jgi:anti-anti-sigma factor
MADQFTMDVSVDDKTVILRTNGYLNNVAGESIAKECYKQIDNGNVKFLLDLTHTKMVNSIGVSILIEIIEKLQDVDGKLGYCNLAPIVEKTFNIMGITQYSQVFSSEEEGISELNT